MALMISKPTELVLRASIKDVRKCLPIFAPSPFGAGVLNGCLLTNVTIYSINQIYRYSINYIFYVSFNE